LNIGGRIKELRKALNHTQEEFANRLRITKGFLSNLEKDIRQPSDQLIKLIAYEFSSSEYWLVSGEGEMFLRPEEVIKNCIARIGEQAYFESLRKVLEEKHPGQSLGQAQCADLEANDPELDRILQFFISLWSMGDEKLKAWAEVQFDRAFPGDIKEMVQRKQPMYPPRRDPET
jgi:transcriptional regulator with XRE-family HTH domain